jgi:hypothetical protein
LHDCAPPEIEVSPRIPQQDPKTAGLRPVIARMLRLAFGTGKPYRTPHCSSFARMRGKTAGIHGLGRKSRLERQSNLGQKSALFCSPWPPSLVAVFHW